MKSIKKFIKEYKFIIILFFLWRAFLFIPQFWSADNLALQSHHLGGGRSNYITSPLFWSWANFDGEHYLSIAQNGYLPLTYFFFPLYPMLIRFAGEIIGFSLPSLMISGILIANISFLVAIIGLYKLVKKDYKTDTALLTVVLLLLFPTSFFFAAVYTESLFLALVIWSFYFARRGKWVYAAVLGGLASATRLVGILLLPALIAEFYLQNRIYFNKSVVSLKSLKGFVRSLPLLFIPAGLAAYMLYLNQKTGDPIIFFHTVDIYGDQRSSTLILLPQVFYRYVVKILPLVPPSYWQGFFTTWLEFLTGLGLLLLSFVSIFRLRLSYAVFLIGSYLLPTLAGSFSSLPRYLITVFPAFLISAIVIRSLPKVFRYIVMLILIAALFIAESLYMRGFWLA